MAMTEVRLLNVPLEMDYAHTLYFGSASAQTTYFKAQGVSSNVFTDFSYQRKEGFIRVPVKLDTLYARKVNYCMYKNSEYSDKWFYAFITDMKYIDDGRTDVYIKTDCIQTWMFDITVKTSFVEREHAKTDVPGDNTIDEGLETGEYVCQYSMKDTKLTSYKYIMLVTEWMPIDGEANTNKPLAVSMGGIFYAGGAYVCDTMREIVNITTVYSGAGKNDAIYAVYIVPSSIINNTSGSSQYSGQDAPSSYDVKFPNSTTIQGYTPKNKKLLTFPFRYLVLSNNSGTANVLKFEYFKNADGTNATEFNFKVKGVPVVGGSIKCSPQRYKGVLDNQEEGIMCGKFPTLSWSEDLFTNWLTQNSVNIGLGVAAGAVQVVGGIAATVATQGAGAAVGVGLAASGVATITNTLSQLHQQSFTPNSAKGNTNAGDINTAASNNTFFFYEMSIKNQYAKVIDEYFNMFGYKTNRVKVPEKNHRENYWYTKTIDANITGGIPQDDLRIIKECYNKGITFWKNPANIKNYGVSNNIV